MSIFQFFRPKPITTEIKATEILKGRLGPLTAKEALAIIKQAVKKIDTTFKFTFVTCAGNISHEGHSYIWELFFDFPRRAARGVFTVQPCDPSAEIEGQDLCLMTQVNPMYAGIAAELMHRLRDDRAASQYVRQIWQKREDTRPALPLEFRDSPEAVRSFAEQGVDFISGDASLSLSSKVLSSGEIVWSAYAYDREFHTPFVA